MAGGVLVASYPWLATGLQVGFDTLVRAKEWVFLVVHDVLVDRRACFAGVLRCCVARTRQFEGVHQCVTIDSA